MLAIFEAIMFFITLVQKIFDQLIYTEAITFPQTIVKITVWLLQQDLQKNKALHCYIY